MAELKPCPFCEGNRTVFPRFCDVPDMDVEAYMIGVVGVDRGGSKVRFTDLVIENNDGDEARFKIDFCPFCGRKLVGEHAD